MVLHFQAILEPKQIETKTDTKSGTNAENETRPKTETGTETKTDTDSKTATEPARDLFHNNGYRYTAITTRHLHNIVSRTGTPIRGESKHRDAVKTLTRRPEARRNSEPPMLPWTLTFSQGATGVVTRVVEGARSAS